MRNPLKLALFLLCMGTVISLGAQGIEHPKVKWKLKTDGPVRGTATIADHTIYFGSADGHIYAVDKDNGFLKWKYATHSPHAGSPYIVGSSLFISGRDNVLYHMNKNTGELKWSFKMGQDIVDHHAGWDYFNPQPVVYENLVIIGSGDSFLYAIDLESGTLKWKYKTDGRIRATALLYDDKIFQPSNDGFVYVIHATTGKLSWKFATDGARYDQETFNFDRTSIFAKPLIKDDVLLLACRDGNVYAIDLKLRKEKWRFSYGTTWAMSTAIDGNTVFVGWSTNNLFCALDFETGKEKWQFKSGAHVYTKGLIVEDAIYIGGADGNIYKLDKENGQMFWKYPIGREIFSSLLYDSNTLFFGGDDGTFYALEDKKGTSFKAVYQPSDIEGNAKYLVANEKITPYLVERSFNHLDTEQKLVTFVKDRLEDKNPSVIVFSLPLIPKNLLGKDPATGWIRKYLESGGKIVWPMGDTPNFYEPDENGNFKRDASTGIALLDVEYILKTDSGSYYSKTTQEGKNMGLPAWIKSTGAVIASKHGIIPLAVDEFGQIHCWMKRFNERSYSGFIALRSWGFNTPIREDDLKLLYKVASYGLE
ncbi:MAG: PQQ-binding-like beta-propeller repeat protein [Bacteroidota bacterium]